MYEEVDMDKLFIENQVKHLYTQQMIMLTQNVLYTLTS